MKIKMLLFFTILGLLFTGCDKVENPMGPDLDPIINPPDPAALVATCSASVLEGDAPLTVEFTGTASGGIAPYSYRWDFEDGYLGGQTVSYTYPIYGRYTVTLTATDSNNTQATCVINDIIVHSKHTIRGTIIGETPKLVDLLMFIESDIKEDEGTVMNSWHALKTTTFTWDFGRNLKEGEYTFKFVLFRCDIYPIDIATIPVKYSFSFWADDEGVEVNPSSGDSGWFSFSGEGDYREFKFTVKETIL